MIKSGVELTNNGSSSGNGAVSIHPVNANWGRLGKAEVYFNVTGAAGTRTIEVSQDGHEFVEFEENLDPYEPNNIDYFHEGWAFFFESNSKYLSVSFAEGSHFALNNNRLLVDTDYDGTYDLYTLDASGEIEITDDPGQYDKYRVLVGLEFPQNNTGSDIADTLTIRGFSASGAQGQTLTISLVHKAAPVV